MKPTFALQVVWHSCGGVARAPWERLRPAAAWAGTGQGVRLVLVLLLGVGCVGTQQHPKADMVGVKRVLVMAQPTEQATPHQLQRLHAAFVCDDGTLLLRIHGKPVNEANTQPCTLEIPPLKRPARANPLARRVEVPSSALRLGWDDVLAVATNARALPIGPVLVIKTKEAYVWDALAPTTGRDEEIRLVQRLGTVSQWEILHLRAQPTAAQARFTIYEVRPAMVPVNNRAALALMPFALAEDVMTNVGTPVAKAGFIPAVGAAFYYGAWWPLKAACTFLWGGINSLNRDIGVGDKEGSP